MVSRVVISVVPTAEPTSPQCPAAHWTHQPAVPASLLSSSARENLNLTLTFLPEPGGGNCSARLRARVCSIPFLLELVCHWSCGASHRWTWLQRFALCLKRSHPEAASPKETHENPLTPSFLPTASAAKTGNGKQAPPTWASLSLSWELIRCLWTAAFCALCLGKRGLNYF